MNRREAISRVSFIFGGAIIGADAFLSGCSTKTGETSANFITKEQIELLDEIGETILPATSGSPGGREAKTGNFMKVMVRDCYSHEEQQIFIEGLTKINEFAEDHFGNTFIELTQEEKHQLLLELEKEIKNPGNEKHYYAMLKQLTIWGFVTSESGATKAFRHVDVPGKFEPCIPLKEGGKAWV